ncbi:hypothetical protein ACKKBG_A38170 [Auxenochlorella protothecoides x Auxenochlorella symbiontica]
MQRSAQSTTTHAVFPRRSAALTPLQLRAISSSPNENRTRPRAGLRAASSGEPGLRPPSEPLQLSAHVVDSIEEISRTEWNACARGTEELNPFVQWDFLHCLEASKSVIPSKGWMPQHLVLRDAAQADSVVACCPLYLKGHSYGEYVFDHSWADAHQRLGLGRYYPKLQSCVPFTPVPGPRLLVKPGPYKENITRALMQTLYQVAEGMNVSSLHLTFCTQEESMCMAGRAGGQYLHRTGIQYHFQNKGYSTFEAYLADLRQSKRKAVRQERKRAREGGIHVSRLTGADLRPSHWDAFYEFYLDTSSRKWGTPYLTRDFFHRLGEAMPDQVVLVMAQQGGRYIAGALNMQGSHTLYGRNWGALGGGDAHKFLHFELCYYQAIEHAIAAGLDRVEAGAQGEHKIQRGYTPSLTHSCHYICNPDFRSIVENFLHRERAGVEFTMRELAMASPFREVPGLPHV